MRDENILMSPVRVRTRAIARKETSETKSPLHPLALVLAVFLEVTGVCALLSVVAFFVYGAP